LGTGSAVSWRRTLRNARSGSSGSMERRGMAQTLTLLTLAVAVGLVWRFKDTLLRRDPLHITIGLDRWSPGAHLIWDIVNTSAAPITLTRLVVHGRRGTADSVPLGLPKVLQPTDRIRLAIDVDWTVIAARSIAAVEKKIVPRVSGAK